MHALEAAPAVVDTPDIRTAGADLLSLALMDARNHTLRLFSVYEEALGQRDFVVPQRPELVPPLWLLGHIGWFQEFWISRNIERHRGADSDASRPKLASIEPLADDCYDPAIASHEELWQLELPDLATIKQYLVDTLETSLELLAHAEQSDAGLYFFRLAVLHEDLAGEALLRMAQVLGLGVPLAAPAVQRPREPLLVPATRWRMGSPPGGFAFDNEQAVHEVAVPEFEIDAQPVSWAQYAEFVEDGGYDDAQWWSSEGWRWLQAGARRSPRYVEQLRQGVLQHRFGRLLRVPLGQPAVHLSAHEAQAWCRWAGRRLPTEPEWELAACTLASRGFRYGEVWEWTASAARPYPGFMPGPWREHSLAHFSAPGHRVLRGGSLATRQRIKHPRFRAFAAPERDDLFSGFRSCAL